MMPHVSIFRLLALLLVPAAVGLSACGSNGPAAVPPYDHVVLIGPDGFSADVLRRNPGRFPHIEQLFQAGSYTLKARSVLPSSSAINWRTLLTGAGSEMHGFTTWGSKTPEVEPAYLNQYGMFPSIFGVVREQRPEATTGVIYSWDGIGYLFEKEAVDLDQFVSTDDSVARQAVAFIRDRRPTLAFVYFSEPDGAGHQYGWESAEYLAACEKIDSLTGVVLAGIRESLDGERTAILFTSDHGGIGKGHGGTTMSEMEVPFVLVGRDVPAGVPIERIVMKYDAAPTVADLLGLPSPEQWRGRSLL